VEIEQHTPWPGRLTCTIADITGAARPQCRVRLVAEVPERALEWLLRRRGATLAPEATADEQPIGLLVSQSGPASMLAGATEYLAGMAIEEINADGPPLGRPLRLVLGDEGTSPAMTALESRRLVDVERCPVVVAATTCHGFAAASAAVRDRPTVLIFSYPHQGGPTGERLFRLGTRPHAQLTAVPHVMSAADGRRWFLAGNDLSWPRATHAWARAIIDRAGGKVVGEHLAPLTTTDIAPLLEAIERSRAECVLSTFFGSNAALFEREFHRAGLRDQCLTLAPALDEATLEHVGAEAGHGIWSVMAYFEQLPTAENREFVHRYRHRFGRFAPPLSGHSESIYETIHLVADAARRAGSWHPTDFSRAMTTSRFDGPRGKVTLFGTDGIKQELFLAEATGTEYTVRRSLGAAKSPSFA
jgi:branched-chain amino acid transport system substrate-binding protein